MIERIYEFIWAIGYSTYERLIIVWCYGPFPSLINMNLEGVVNQYLWVLVLHRYPDTVIFCCHDHNFQWHPNKYYLPVYLSHNLTKLNEENLKLEFQHLIQSLTGLKSNKISIVLYTNHDITVEKSNTR